MISAIVALGAVLASCGPSAYLTQVQMRYPSSTGIDLGGKSIAVVFLHGEADSLYNAAVADAFATGLEADYFDGAQAIDVYSMPKDGAGEYKSLDTLSSLVMDLNSDVVFLLDTPVLVQGEQRQSAVSRLYYYDSLDSARDSVRLAQNSVLVESLDNPAIASVMGKSLASKFAGVWKDEVYTIIAYDSWENTWVEALYDVSALDWASAINKWLSLLDTRAVDKRSCAEYNLALGCYMSGEYGLAKEWLDRSDADKPLSISNTLRKRIEDRLK